MGKRITNELREEMIRLYAKLNNYSAVARELKISAATVSKYVKKQQSIKTYNESIAAKPIENISLNEVLSFSFLSEEEKQSYQNWLKEFR